MLTKGSGSILGDGGGISSSSIIGAGFSSDVFAAPSTSSHVIATHNNNNNIMDMDKFLLFGSSIDDSVSSSFKPQLHDMELRRRARNNAILAKIQELEANACVQVARSERLRMMREEYESLVRKYASTRKSQWETSSASGHFNANNNNGFPPNRYLQPFSPQQAPFISFKEPAPPAVTSTQQQQQLLTTINTHPFIPSMYQPTSDMPSNMNRSFVTTGVNTDITGPVKSSPVLSQDDNKLDDLQGAQERRNVAVIITDSSSQTAPTIEMEITPQQMESQVENTQVLSQQQYEKKPEAKTVLLLPPPSSSSATALVPQVPFIYDTTTNQDTIVMDRNDGKEALSLKPKKNLPTNVEMMLIMLDDEEDESSCQAEERRKQQLESFHHQLLKQPKASLREDTNSISSSPSTPVGVEFLSTSNNTTEEVRFKQRQRQKQQQQHQREKAAAEHEKGNQKKRNQKNNNNETEEDEETSQDTFSNNKKLRSVKGGEGLSKKILLRDDDISLSDSTSAFSAFRLEKHQNQRKKLLEQLASASNKDSNSIVKNKTQSESGTGHGGDGDQQENLFNNSSEEDDDEERSIIRSEDKKDEATSESIGDSTMDSIQKTPDAQLPRDDSELQEIMEVNERESDDDELEEIEKELALRLSSDVGTGKSCHFADWFDNDDDAFVVTATAVTADTKNPRSSSTGGGIIGSKPIRIQSGVNDMTSVERKIRLQEDPSIKQDGIKGYEVQINDAKEICSNNLSSSKADVPAEEENNFTHANNPGGTNSGITTSITFQETLAAVHSQNTFKEEKEKVRKNPTDAFYEDVEHSKDKELMVHENMEFLNPPFPEEQIVNGDSSSIRVNESSKKIPHLPAPSANMSAHSSSTSSFSSGSNGMALVEENRETKPGSIPASTTPASTNLLAGAHYSTGSSSSSFLSQHSLDDQVAENVVAAASSNNISQTKKHSNSGSHHGSPQPVELKQEQQHQSLPTLPQSVHKRHQLLQEQVIKEEKENETTPPVGADVMPERLTSSSGSSSPPMFEVVADTTTNNLDVNINNGTRVIPLEKSVPTMKTAKGSIPAAFNVGSTLSPSSSSKKASGNAGISDGNAASGNGAGSSGGGSMTSSIRTSPGTRSSKSSGKQVPGTNVTIPSGPTGAQNTARRVRLKLHEDSDTDSSEIGSGKSQPATLAKGNFSGNKGNAANSGSNANKPSSINTNKNMTGEHESQKSVPDKKSVAQDVDDDFEDFFDI